MKDIFFVAAQVASLAKSGRFSFVRGIERFMSSNLSTSKPNTFSVSENII
jgi:hypothetical protein